MQDRTAIAESRRLSRDVEKSRKRLIRTELTLAENFRALAETESSRDPNHARQLAAMARHAAESVRRMVSFATLSQHEREEVTTRLENLDKRSANADGLHA